MRDEDRLMDRVVAVLKEPVQIDPGLDGRVMVDVSRLAAPRRPTPIVSLAEWLVRRRTVRVSPLGALAAAAGITLVVLAGRAWLGGAEQPAPTLASAVTAVAPTHATSVIQFVVVAPGASSVSLVGDFNDWDRAATPMQRAPGNGLWSVTVPLAPGRYRYSFLVDGTTWVPDPEAPRALGDDFGRPNSVLTVGGA